MTEAAGLGRVSGLPGRAPRWPAYLLVFLGAVSVASPSPGRRLVCWQAIVRCHSEPECHYAYEQYLHACAPVLSGEGRRGARMCPSHCISSLVQLNRTRGGPALEDCDCAADPVCRQTRRAIEPCLPRTRSTGCTEARWRCERDGRCGGALRDYLLHCSKLFSGARCTEACLRVIADMRRIPRAIALDTCECDGAERNICEFVKTSMRSLCFDERPGSGFSPRADDDEDEEDEEEDEASNELPGLKQDTRGHAAALHAQTFIGALLSLLSLLGPLS